ncbi:MAG: nucleoside triphosphate pyrophosphohydrolase [Clostridiales bacterium]|jgi:tetrapyrrole methylase family protein/MazG family protein|nr:nucleoside triphosphate pyrophosphohydrolase [Clostridiales bacterium]
MSIKIIGLGYKDGDISVKGMETVQKADFVVLRSKKLACADCVKKSEKPYTALDFLYETAADFDELNKAVVDFVTQKATEYKSVAYLVGGSGTDDVAAAALIKNGAELIAGVSAAAYAIEAVQKTAAVSDDGLCAAGHTEISAYELISEQGFFPDKRWFFVVKDIDNVFTAAEVKLKLSGVYGDVKAAIMYSNGEIIQTTLFEIDRQKKSVYDYRTALIVPPSDFLKNPVHDMSDIYRIMKRLRGNDGCKWDMAQTHKSIAVNAVEEAYELVDAIDCEDIGMIVEESGDVLLQAVFHAVIAEDENDFTFSEMLTALGKKLITRHTHIFGEDKANDDKEALSVWEKAKAKEKKHRGLTDKIKSVPRNFPALLRAEKVMKAASKYGFEYANAELIFDKLKEELIELKAADSGAERKDEGGDVLLTTVNLLRHYGVEPETALKDAVNKVEKRLIFMDEAAKNAGKSFFELTYDEKVKYWSQAKQTE